MRGRLTTIVMMGGISILAGDIAQPARHLRVCADPNNLPFSNRAQQGFENRIAETIARDLGARVEYTWWPGRRHYPRNTLGAGRCDLIFGVPEGAPEALTTAPYYRSEYVAVYRKDRGWKIRSFDDPVLKRLRIGLHITDFDFTPPGAALGRRGITNIKGFRLYGPKDQPNPPSEIFEALAKGDIDVAMVWGPFAGYFAPRQSVPLEISPLPLRDGPLPLSFAIAAGVRKGDQERRAEIDAALHRRSGEISTILRQYGVPLLRETH